MSLRSVVSSPPASFVSHSIYSNKGNNVLVSRQVRLPRLSKEANSSSLIRCEAVVAPSTTNGEIPGATIAPAQEDQHPIQRSDFPTDFMFGAATSALQTEGPADIGARGPSTWDYMISLDVKQPEFKNHENLYVATLSYDLFKEDVKLLKNMGVDVYRFSISWSRILPQGTGEINQEGLDFYNNLINELCANGIKPCVTLFHFDLPSCLQKKYNGFLDRQIVADFTEYCKICFTNFGDRVKLWTTINEPLVFAQHAYTSELIPEDNPTQDPYIVAHNIILAHASAVRLYKDSFQADQMGEIGIPVSTEWFKPHSESIVDKDAAARTFAFSVGWFLEPLVHGDYPFIMKAVVLDRLPTFTAEEQELVKGAYDFIGINYYTSNYAQGLPFDSTVSPTSYADDPHVSSTETNVHGKYIGHPVKDNSEIYAVPEGLRDVLIYMKDNYDNPKIYITENGVTDKRSDTTHEEALNDHHRIVFIRRHLRAVLEALRTGVNVNGYFVWSLMDCMEVGSGYDVRYGLNYTEYGNKLKRRPKQSALWLKEFLNQQN